jgi:hypothetical protein
LAAGLAAPLDILFLFFPATARVKLYIFPFLPNLFTILGEQHGVKCQKGLRYWKKETAGKRKTMRKK